MMNDVIKEWVLKHSTAGLTEPLNFSKYNKFLDCWSITVNGIEYVNPTPEKVMELYEARDES